MNQITRLITLFLVLLVPAFAAQTADDFNAAFLERRVSGGECGSIPCSGNQTCMNYSCGYCMEDYCEPSEEQNEETAAAESAVAAAESAAATMMPAMPASAAAGNGVAAGFMVVAVGAAAAALL